MRLIFNLFIIFFSLLGSDEAFAFSCSNPPETLVKPSWIYQKDPTPRSVILIGHGLNMRASAMDTLGIALGKKGNSHVLRLTLSGHGGTAKDNEVFKTVTRDLWLEDFFAQYCIARARADQFHIPLYFVGFSLSSLIGLDALEHENEIHFDRMTLLAPPAAVWPLVNLMKLLRVLGREHMVKSNAQPSYRASMEGTPVAAYIALFEAINSYRDSYGARSHIPSLVVMDPEDELVSLNGLKWLVNDFNLTNDWHFFEVTNSGTKLNSSYHHFITDDVALGDLEFQRMVEAISEHLMEISYDKDRF